MKRARERVCVLEVKTHPTLHKTIVYFLSLVSPPTDTPHKHCILKVTGAIPIEQNKHNGKFLLKYKGQTLTCPL